MIFTGLKHTFWVVIIALLFLILPAKAINLGFSPEKYPSDKDFGIGAYFAPKTIKIYEKPEATSQVKEILTWKYANIQLDSLTGTIDDPNKVFLAYYPFKEIALIAVSDQLENWLEVIYDQENGFKGWIQLKSNPKKTQYNQLVGNFYTWYDFMIKIAHTRGMYFLSGVPEESRKLRGQPSDKAKPINIESTFIRSINMKMLRGNWMLVKIMYMSEESPYGWVRWRDDSGKLMLFCDLK